MGARARHLLATWLVVGLALSSGNARAQDDARQESLLRLLKARPRGMSADTWREQRREAARELGRLKEKRAVPTLLAIIAKERFDVILEIAIDALGEMGDRRAVEPLKALLHDPALDAYVRDAVAGALKKLGAGAKQPTPVPPEPKTGPKPTVKPPPKVGQRPEESPEAKPAETEPPKSPPCRGCGRPEAQRHGFGELPRLNLSPLDREPLARQERFDIVAGGGHLRWDGASGQASAGAFGRTRYYRQLERRAFGYSVDGAASVAFDLARPPAGNTAWSFAHDLAVNPEVRYYPFQRDLPLFFVQAAAGLGYGLGLAALPLAPDKRFSFAAHASVGGGPGYGRIVNVGSRLRAKRLERVLLGAGLLKGPLSAPATSALSLSWYKLRNQLGSFRQLGHTLELLREHGMVRDAEPDAATVYRMIRILDDPQLDDRPDGMLFRLGYGYARTFVKEGQDRDIGFLYATGEFRRQRQTTRAFQAELRFYWNMIGEDDLALSAKVSYDWLLYNTAFDPLGILSATLTGGFSSQPGLSLGDHGLGYRLLGGASYSRHFTRGSRVAASLLGGVDNGGGLVLFTLEAQYGIAAGSYLAAE
ncbi:MAG: HEAT repeat domain-containing protein [Deltaproteobacteria bacterium]|nr:HEAT repeat domain-containing protein [Deltaproteobacteria bacterium]